jgi:hypothetical protein
MGPVKPPMDTNSRTSASAVDADSTAEAARAAQSEIDRYEERDKPSFGGGGRHQLQRDSSFGQPEKRTGK